MIVFDTHRTMLDGRLSPGKNRSFMKTVVTRYSYCHSQYERYKCRSTGFSSLDKTITHSVFHKIWTPGCTQKGQCGEAIWRGIILYRFFVTTQPIRLKTSICGVGGPIFEKMVKYSATIYSKICIIEPLLSIGYEVPVLLGGRVRWALSDYGYEHRGNGSALKL